VIIKQHTKLDERFIVAWPHKLLVGKPDFVVVRIAANDYENLLAGLEPDHEVRSERFRGEAKLEVTLTGDSGMEIVRQHSDQQTVERNQRHREWSWSIFPKATGLHQLTLLVQSVAGDKREDYDPEVRQWDVGFNPSYWFSNGIQQNGINWLWTIIVAAVTGAFGYLMGKRKSKKAPRGNE
jgi:hypothetical protein